MSTGPTIFEIGTTIGDYYLISVIGRGGMGKVFKVSDLLSDRTGAMKVLLPDIDARPDLVERFLREIKVVAALEHPGIRLSNLDASPAESFLRSQPARPQSALPVETFLPTTKPY